MNKLAISGTVIDLQALRYTPAGLPLLSFQVSHTSELIEADLKRKVECKVNAVIIGDLAKTDIQLGTQLKALGFLANKSVKSSQLVFHITHLEVM